MPRILVLSTSYPSSENDPSGVFIAKLVEAIVRGLMKPNQKKPEETKECPTVEQEMLRLG